MQYEPQAFSEALAEILCRILPEASDESEPEGAREGVSPDALAEAMLRALERKDGGTGLHVQRTAEYAVRIARELPSMTEALVERVRLAAILHDLGKIAIEDRILTKPAALEAAERDAMRMHPELGYDIVTRMPGLEDVAQGVLFHHERWDGRGYPYALAEERIPWIARLIAVADAFDAMISVRPYRDAIAPRQAYQAIVLESGAQFDPRMVRAFESAFARDVGAIDAGATA
jgi:HD-GYP domain-containing protein (c-di-GMP phosphodiesterase class II)